MTQHNRETRGFYGLGIAPGLLAVIEKLGYLNPTPIQAQAIPIAIQGKDIVGVAQTGTGKTLAFGVPMIQILAQQKGLGLVLVPTRELALQVDEVFRSLGRALGLRTAVLIGGAPMNPQISALRRNPHVIIGTPGRIIDHLKQKTVHLNFATVLVLDEADRMFDLGFLPAIKQILKAVPSRDKRQTMLFSATISPDIMAIAAGTMKLPVRVEIAASGTTVEQVTQEIFIVSKEAKMQLLEKLLSEYTGSALVFTRTKHFAKRVVRDVREMGHSAAEIHSNRSLNQRREALSGFKSGKYRVLVATDIAARGIDVVGIELVINYDLPSQSQDYVHRIGRTARAGSKGHAISFATPDQKNEIRGIERFIRKALPVSPVPELPPARQFTHPEPRYAERQPGRLRGGRPRIRRGGGGGRRPPRRYNRGV